MSNNAQIMIRSQYHKIIFPGNSRNQFEQFEALAYPMTLMYLSAEQVQHKTVSANIDTQKIKHKIYVIVGLSSSSKAALETLGLKIKREAHSYLLRPLLESLKCQAVKLLLKNGFYKPGNCNYIISSPMGHSL